MNKKTLVWRERTSELELIASVWACNSSEATSRTVLADPCISIILIRHATGAEVIIRGPETVPREELLMPGYTWTAIRLRPGLHVKGVPVEQLTDNFLTLPTDSEAQFQLDNTWLHFPDFRHTEQLIERMRQLHLIGGEVLKENEHLKQGISSKSYSRLIKRSTGLSPYKLRQLERIHEALRLLKQGTPATTVAAELGFVDQAHLTRAARQFFGHTPRELLDLPQRH